MLNFIVAIITLLISIIFIPRGYRKCETIYEKVIFILMCVVVLSLIVVYNISSKLGCNAKIDTQTWLSFILNCFGTIISAIIGAVALVYMTMYQINQNKEDNNNRDKENNRIQNMPLLKYKIDACSGTIKKDNNIETEFSENTGQMYFFKMDIENVGLGCVKDIVVKIESNIIKKPHYIISDESRYVLKKDEKIEEIRNCYLKSNKTFKFILNVYYEDLLNNWYLQKVEIDYSAENLGKVSSVIVKEEELSEKDAWVDNKENM